MAMKGVVFKHFESFVVDSFGEELYETVLGEAELGSDGVFLGPETYPDADLFALVGKVLEKTGLELPAALQAFGRFLFDALADGAPVYLEGHDLRSFLESVDSVIHVEVRKLFPDAETPEIEFQDAGPATFVMRYRSSRQLCHLFRGLLEGSAARFGEKIDYRESDCMLHGADACEFRVQVAGEVNKAA